MASLSGLNETRCAHSKSSIIRMPFSFLHHVPLQLGFICATHMFFYKIVGFYKNPICFISTSTGPRRVPHTCYVPLNVFRVCKLNYLIHKYLLCACDVPGPFLVAEDTTVNNMNQNPAPVEADGQCMNK